MDTPETFARQVAAEVRDALKAAGVSQRQASMATQIPLVTLGRRLGGVGKPIDLWEVAVLAELVGLSVTELTLRAEKTLARGIAV